MSSTPSPLAKLAHSCRVIFLLDVLGTVYSIFGGDPPSAGDVLFAEAKSTMELAKVSLAMLL